MVNCCIKSCHNKPVKGSGIRFFLVPAVRHNECERTFLFSSRRRALWLARINRKDLNVTHNTRICSRHFISGEPAPLMSDTDPDWAPTLNLGYNFQPENVIQCSVDRNVRRMNRAGNREVLRNIENIVGCEPVVEVLEAEDDQGTQFVDACTQTDLGTEDLKKFENVAMASSFTEESLKNDDHKVKFYTGVHTFELLKVLFDNVCKYLLSRNSINIKLTRFQEFCLVLMRLRLGLEEEDLAYRFSIDQSTVSRIMDCWLPVMCHVLNCLIVWPDRETLKKTMPECFKDAFDTSVTVIIDCFEIRCESPSSLLPKAQTYSQYKSHSTVKVLLCITPQGTICFVSLGWGGRSSDKRITLESGFLDKLITGDVVLADRGFDIAEDVGILRARVLIPCFKGTGRNQLSSDELEITREIAQVRIHVERVIGLLRKKFRILDSTLHHSWLKSARGESLTRIDQAIRVCCALTNLCPPIVPMTTSETNILS